MTAKVILMPLIKQHLDGRLLKCVAIALILTAKDVKFFILPIKSLQTKWCASWAVGQTFTSKDFILHPTFRWLGVNTK